MIAERILNRLCERLCAALAPPALHLRTWRIEETVVGYLDDARAERLAGFPRVFVVEPDAVHLSRRLDTFAARTVALDEVTRTLSTEGALTRWRDERYEVTAAPGAAPLLLLERAAARYFGIRTCAAHVNGVTVAGGAPAMWIARRSALKPIDPGLLDNLVGGGIAAGAGIAATVVKEAWEEAGIDPALAAAARPVGEVALRRAQPDGIQRETIFVHDLALPAEFVPCNQDGEVASFRRCTVAETAELAGNVEGVDVFTVDAALVIADWLVRRGELPTGSAAYRALEAVRRATLE